jgi:hypothetical protein
MADFGISGNEAPGFSTRLIVNPSKCFSQLLRQLQVTSLSSGPPVRSNNSIITMTLCSKIDFGEKTPENANELKDLSHMADDIIPPQDHQVKTNNLQTFRSNCITLLVKKKKQESLNTCPHTTHLMILFWPRETLIIYFLQLE